MITIRRIRGIRIISDILAEAKTDAVYPRKRIRVAGVGSSSAADAGCGGALGEIAAAQRLPETFLAKIFQKLARHGVVVSERGRGSGYALARPPANVTVSEIFEAVEGPQIHQRCLLWQGHCADHDPCPLHYRLRALVPAIQSLLESVTLADYVAESPHFTKHAAAAAGAVCGGRAADAGSGKGGH